VVWPPLRVVIHKPVVFFLNSERTIKSKLNFLMIFMKKEDISKLITTNGQVFKSNEHKLKSVISLLQRLGVESDVLPKLVATTWCFLMFYSEKKIMEAFKGVEDLGLKGSTRKKIMGALKCWWLQRRVTFSKLFSFGLSWVDLLEGPCDGCVVLL